jgi:hypothetical protein
VFAIAVSTAVSVGAIIPARDAFVAPTGHEVRATVVVVVSPTAKIPDVVTVVVAAVPCTTAAVAADSVVDTPAGAAAFEGATDITPKPNAATVTSAMRLKVVFVDICFLSIVDSRTIPDSAWIVFRPSSR